MERILYRMSADFNIIGVLETLWVGWGRGKV